MEVKMEGLACLRACETEHDEKLDSLPFLIHQIGRNGPEYERKQSFKKSDTRYGSDNLPHRSWSWQMSERFHRMKDGARPSQTVFGSMQ
jgi:hypothetical protein